MTCLIVFIQFSIENLKGMRNLRGMIIMMKQIRSKIPRKPFKKRLPSDCIERLKLSSECSPLPCRENHISLVHQNIEKAFFSEEPILFICSGKSGTGKTSIVRLCVSMSPYQNRIGWINCRNDSPFIPLEQESGERKLLILDQCEVLSTSGLFEIIDFYFSLSNISLFMLTTVFCQEINSFPALQTSGKLTHISLAKYDSSELFLIFHEKLADTAGVIEKNALLKLSQFVVNNQKM